MNNKQRHVIGVDALTLQSRVSTSISSWDLATQTATTKSGNTYVLIGPPAHDPNDNETWREWQIKKKVVTALDVTQEYITNSKA